MRNGKPRRKVHIVEWRTPLGSSISPYINKAQAVRRLSYARLQAALDMVEAKPAGKVLDFGCWDGYFLPSLLRHFDEVWGVDDDSASVFESVAGCWTILNEARGLCESETGSTSRLGLTKATGPALPFRDRCFDTVFCLDTLVHVPIPLRLQVIHELRRITKPDGQLIFSLPVELGLIGFVRQLARTLTGKHADPITTDYDFRPDLEMLHSLFATCTHRFAPIDGLGTLNPMVLADCRIAEEPDEGFSKSQGHPAV